MDKQEIKDKNKFIAKFMGVVPTKDWFDGWELHKAGLPFSCGAMGNGTNELKFHTSWDWLMPAVHKCLGICHEEMLNEWENSFCDKFSACDITVMYKEVIEFLLIIWKDK